MDTVFIKLEELKRFMIKVFERAGVPQKDAEICADNLITADRLGIDSHGINRLKEIYYDRIKMGIQNPITNFEIVKEGPTTAVIDGHNGMGHVIGYKAMKLAIEKAKNFGLGMTVVRNSNHYGIAGYYALMACKEDMIGITGTNARPSIAPTFGTENMLGTNPLTFGIPTDEEFPFLLDCATSITQRGKIESYAKKGIPCPPGLVITSDGSTLTDAELILKYLTEDRCALLPLGGAGEETAGYKGYGYATVVEILSASLQNGAFLKMLSGINEKKERVPYRLGHFFIAINISSFIEPETFKKITGNILRSLRASKKAPGCSRIYTAGEKEYIASIEREKNGVPINKKLQEEIKTMISELNLKDFNFPFL